MIFNQLHEDYPWSVYDAIKPFDQLNLWNKLRAWLFLSDYSHPPLSYLVVADFFQVFFVWLQLGVFQEETKHESVINELAGKNDEFIYDQEELKNNPYHDFVSVFRNNLDKIKYIIFMYSYWPVLAVVYISGKIKHANNKLLFICYLLFDLRNKPN
jgi:hypothetical protein